MSAGGVWWRIWCWGQRAPLPVVGSYLHHCGRGCHVGRRSQGVGVNIGFAATGGVNLRVESKGVGVGAGVSVVGIVGVRVWAWVWYLV